MKKPHECGHYEPFDALGETFAQARCIAAMRFDVLTLFPEIFSGYLSQSLLRLAIERGIVEVQRHDLRDWAKDKHRTVDDRPFGGGPGMVLRVEPVVECVEEVLDAEFVKKWGQAPPGDSLVAGEPPIARSQSPFLHKPSGEPGHLVMLTPQGRPLRQCVVEELAEKKRLVLLCGRYEGFDERIREILRPDEISVGDYILGGGEVAAMVVIDAVVRLVPGVLGDEESNRQDSFSGSERLLEFGQYTRPREYRGRQVPEVLLRGNHQEIAAWRRQQSLARTQQRRADLLEKSPPADAIPSTRKDG